MAVTPTEADEVEEAQTLEDTVVAVLQDEGHSAEVVITTAGTLTGTPAAPSTRYHIPPLPNVRCLFLFDRTSSPFVYPHTVIV